MHGVWKRGLRCPARLAGSRAQFDSATRFSSPGDPPKFSGVLETSVRAQNAPVLARGDCCPPGKGCNRAGPSSRDEAGVLQPLLHRTQERRWSSTNPGFATPEPGPAQAPVQDVDAQAYDQMRTAPGLVCSDRPEGCLLSCFDPSPTQTVPQMAVQGPPLRALPLSPCLHEGRRGRPCPLTEERAQSVLNCLSSFGGRTVVPLKQFQRLLGHMASAAAVTPLGLLHMRPLQHWLHSRVPRWHGAAVHFE